VDRAAQPAPAPALRSLAYAQGSAQAQSAPQRALLRQVARTGGNRAAQELALRMQGAPPAALARQAIPTLRRDDDEQEGEVTHDFFGLSDVQAIRARMQMRFLRAQNYALEGVRTGDAVRSSLLRLSSQYSRAWERYSRVIGAGRAEARNQQDWTNICVGIGVGILLGVAAAFLLPSTAAGAFALTLNEAAVAGASAAGQATGGAILASGVTSAFRIEGTELSPEGMEPAVLEMTIWRRAAEMYRDAVRFVPTATNLHLLAMAGEYLSGQIRTRVAGGQVDMSDDDMLDLLETLTRADNAMSRVDRDLQTAITRLQQIRQSVSRGLPQGYGSREMEQDIWVLWMSRLPPSQYDILDLDAIENYLHGSIGILGPNSLLGVDFGQHWYSWTSAADERAAVAAAQRRAGEVQARFRQLQGGS
jgi:hypothetical protein